MTRMDGVIKHGLATAKCSRTGPDTALRVQAIETVLTGTTAAIEMDRALDLASALVRGGNLKWNELR